MGDQKPVEEPTAPPNLRVGCAMWGLREWVGPYFPPTTRTGQELGVYATWCTAVEGNTTFYGLPTAAAVDRWRDAVPADFRFVFKLPRTITHDRRLRNTGDLLREFCHVTEPLEAVLGPTSIQLPATFDETDMAVLEQFIVQLSTNRRWAVGSEPCVLRRRTLRTPTRRLVICQRTRPSDPR